MDTSLSTDQETLLNVPEAPFVISLLERGTQCARQGAYAEGVAFFALALEHLTPQWASLAAALDAVVKSNVNYWQAQQMLHLASKRFAEADVEQKNSLLAIEKLLPALVEESGRETPPLTQPQPLQLYAERMSLPANVQAASTNSRASYSSMNEAVRRSKENGALPDLYITCFGHFEIRRLDETVPLCQNRNGQTILRYLVAQPKYSASRDVLMAILWPEDAPEVALHKLQIAVSALRRLLNRGYATDTGGGYILYKEPFYLLNPAVTLRTDVDEFLSLWQMGRATGGSEAIKFFEQAMDLYANAFLVEDMYADWSVARREKLSQISLAMCRVLTSHYLEAGCYEEAEKWACENLKGDRCDEKAHRQLMQIYFARGLRSEALRQYQRCEHILAEELGIAPTSETVNLLHALLADEIPPQVEGNRAKIESK